MPKSLLVTSFDGVTHTDTQYMPMGMAPRTLFAVEANAQVRYRTAGTISNLEIRSLTNATTATSTVAVRKNAASVISVSLGAGSTGIFANTATSVEVASGDDFCYMATPGSANNLAISWLAVALETPTVTISRFVSAGRSTSVSATYYAEFGANDAIAETPAQQRMGIAGTLKNLFLRVPTNTRTSDSTLKSRINATTGNLLVTVTAGTTGVFEDTANTDVIVAGDLVTLEQTMPTGTGTFHWGLMAVSLEHVDRFHQQVLGGGIAVAAGFSRYFPPSGGMLAGSNVSTFRTTTRIAGAITDHWFRVPTNTLNVVASISIQRNGINVITQGVPAGTTGDFNVSTVVAILATENLQHAMVVPSGSGSISIDQLGFVIAEARTVTKSIGTSSRDYSTITAWEADLDDTSVYFGDHVIGECYNDSAFNENVNINVADVIPSARLTVAAGHRHTGVAGSGARILSSSSAKSFIVAGGGTKATIEWLELDFNQIAATMAVAVVISATGVVTRRMLVHGFYRILGASSSTTYCVELNSTGQFLNNVVYDMYVENTSTGGGHGVRINSSQSTCLVNNNTVHGVRREGGSGGTVGISSPATCHVRNNIAAATSTTGSGGAADFTYISTGTRTSNLSTDATADDGGGTNHIIDAPVDDLFVSTVPGSEDFSLKPYSPAIQMGFTGTAVNEWSIDAKGVDRLTRHLWDIGALEYVRTVTKSIGTTGRDYSTMTAWEADLDNAAVYSPGDDAVGECYNDSAFAAGTAIDGGGTLKLNYVRLSVAAGQRHNGTANTGVRVLRTANIAALGDTINLQPFGTNTLTVEWIDYDVNDFNTSISHIVGFEGAVAGRVPTVRGMIVHGINTSGSGVSAISGGTSRDGVVIANIVYDWKAFSNLRTMFGIRSSANQVAGIISNNTVYGVSGHDTGQSIGIDVTIDNANGKCRNNISAGNSPNSVAFKFAGAALLSSHNLSDDATADDGGGLNHLINQTLADLFVSTVPGSEDLSLKAGSPAINTGVNLGSNPVGVNIDAKGRDRVAEADVWDIGAIEYVSLVVTLIVRPNGTIVSGDWQAVGAASLHSAVNDENDATYAESLIGGATRTVELLEGATVIASRNLTPTTSLAGYRLALTTLERDSVVDWTNLRLRITDGGAPATLDLPALAVPTGEVAIGIRMKV